MGIRAAVIGAGSISQFHFSGLTKADADIRWVCDLNESAAADWAGRVDARATTDYTEVLADPDVDLVDITTISSAHKRLCLDAIAAGKAVICEKTLAGNADDALEIVQAAQAAGTIFYTSYMKRFLPALAKAKELLPSLGRLLTTHIRAHQPWGDGHWMDDPADERAEDLPAKPSFCRERYGGGILVCGGSHVLDLVLFLVGRPHKLYASVFTPVNRDYDLRASALMETANGSVLYEALTHPLSRIGFLGDGWDERIEITGLRGRLEIWTPLWNAVDTKASLLRHYDNATATVQEYRFRAESPFDHAVAHFCDQVAAGEQGPQSRVTGYDVDELIAHFHRSADSGAAVDVTYRV
jgi:predicted dehydrogenase